MLKRVTLVLVSLLLLNGCAELIQVLGGDGNDNGFYSPYNSTIQVNNVHTNGFDLSWDETYYNNGSNGSFYYELYVVEGNQNNVYNFYYYDIVAEGWNLTFYNVTGLEPGTTYSYVVGVSEDEFGSQVYYNIGSVTTEYISLDFIGEWYSEHEGMYDVFTLEANSITIGHYDMYGNHYGDVYGSLTPLSNDTIKIVIEYESDEYPYETVIEEYILTWSIYGDSLTLDFGDGSTEVLYAFDESIFSSDPFNGYLYVSYTWQDLSIEYEEVQKYYVDVTPGSIYTIRWDDDYDGSGYYDADITVSIDDTFGTILLGSTDSGYNSPQTFTVPYGVYTIAVNVTGYYAGGSYSIQIVEEY